MIGFNSGSEVIYQCSTRLTAGSGIGVGVFIALVFAWILGRDWLLMDKGNLWGIAAFMLVGVLIALRGVYLYCRPRVETRHIVVGNLTHRLYLRNKPLFVLFTGGVYALVVVGVTLVFDLIEWAVEGRLRNLMIVALAFAGGALKYYLDYYYYSRWLKNNG